MRGLNPESILPAIDVRSGRVVRLRQGDYARETVYADDPLAVAQGFRDAGAGRLHLVDLDAARKGGYSLRPLLRRISEQTGLSVQTGGGIRGRDDIAKLLDAGASQVVVGSLAVQEPGKVSDWLDQFGGDAITLALDTRPDDEGRWMLPVRGWTADAGVELFDLAARYADAGLRHLLCTDIRRDGMLSGPNLDLYRALSLRVPALSIQASGGLRDAGDVSAALDAGCAAAVLGRALLEGHIDLASLLASSADAEPTPC
ncbi:MAG: 1-(5-phosphoribosyl)-5-((5-phosphoribosylamino)methylideneamino)imidazole-4-carboxamide isomerase [Xanthomonadales bacterium]|nr:1-(5-phosphoribosyl)-5-((5-phosphoribosylamino)methylideneamino)imidazole-4-carboxamide isomerase [Xanthomonadales bacterium]